MKKILLVLIFSAVSFSATLGNGQVIEPDAIIYDFQTPGVVKELVGVVKAHGYKCDSVSFARPLVFKPGFEIQCNYLRYTYQVVDRGGRWTACINKCK